MITAVIMYNVRKVDNCRRGFRHLFCCPARYAADRFISRNHSGKRGEYMPAAYAHDRFGTDVLNHLPRSLRVRLSSETDLFYAGLQGPDIFFYYHPLVKNEISSYGALLHDSSGYSFFQKQTAGRDEAAAYLAGILCHFTLDTACHPYVDRFQETNQVRHEVLEGDFDRFLLDLDGKVPVAAVQPEHFLVSGLSAAVISTCYPDDRITERVVKKAMNQFVRLHNLLRCPGSLKRSMLVGALKLIGKYDIFKGHIMQPMPDPDCLEADAALLKLYRNAVQDAADLVSLFLQTYGTDRYVKFLESPLLSADFNGRQGIIEES